MEHPTRRGSFFSHRSIRSRRKKILASALSLFVLLVGMPTLLLGADPATADVSIVVDGNLEPAYAAGSVSDIIYTKDSARTDPLVGQVAVLETDTHYYLGFQQAFEAKSNVYCEGPNQRPGCDQFFNHLVTSDYSSLQFTVGGRTIEVPVDILRSDSGSPSGYASFVGGGDGGNLSGIDASAVEGKSAMDYNLNVHGWRDLVISPNYSSTPDHPYIYPSIVEIGLDKNLGSLPDGLDFTDATFVAHNSPESKTDTPRHASMTCLSDHVVEVGEEATFPVTTFEGALPKAGQDIVALLTGEGSIVSVGGTPGNAGQTDGSGAADVVVTSNTPGTSSVKAFWDLDGNGAWDPATEPVTEPACPIEWRFEPQARISITPDATNEVGDDHTFTVHVEENDGTGWADAAAEDVTAVIDSGPGTLTTPSCVTDGNGECDVVLHSDDTGVTVVSAASDVDVAGTILPRTTNGQDGNSGPVTKTWVDLKIEVSPLTATNEVNDEHVVTATVSQDDGSGTWDPVPDGTAVDFSLHANSANASFVGADDCTTAAGTCQVTINTSSPGDVDIRATSTVSVGGVSMTRTTNSGGNNSADANKVYVDARIAISPDGVNRVGDDHTFTVLVEENDGSGWADAAGEDVTADIDSGPGALTTASCTTDADGTCDVVLSSNDTGTTLVSASSDVSVGGLTLARTTDGQNGNSGPATKQWVDALILINPPQAANQVGNPHDLTITVFRVTGGVDVLAEGVLVTTEILDGPGAFVDGENTCTTDANGECTVTIESAETGLTVVQAAATVGVDGVAIPLVTDGEGDKAAPATKRWVDARLGTTPEADANRVDDPHTFDALLELDLGDGQGFGTAPAGESIAFSKVSGPGTLSPTSCTTDASGSCSVVLESAETGLTRVSAEWTGTIATAEGQADAVASSNDATKRWVDAQLTVTPEQATNVVGDTHTFAALLELDLGDGAGFAPAPVDETITWAIESGPGALSTETCTTDADGTCTTDLDSSESGTTVVSAAWDGDITTAEGVVSTVVSDDATKDWVSPAIEIVKTADPEGGPPRDVTYTYLVTNIGDVTLTNVDVTDDILGAIGTIESLEPGESATLETTVAVDETSPVVNVGTACGDPTVDGAVIGDEVCDDDDAEISVVLGETIVRPQVLPRTGTGIHVATALAAILIWLGAAAYLAEDRFGWIRRRR